MNTQLLKIKHLPMFGTIITVYCGCSLDTSTREKKNKKKRRKKGKKIAELKQKILTTFRNLCPISSHYPSIQKSPTNQIKSVLLFQPSGYQKPCKIKASSTVILRSGLVTSALQYCNSIDYPMAYQKL